MSDGLKTPSQTPKRVRVHPEPSSASRPNGLPLKSPAHVNTISLGLATPSTPSSVKKTKQITPLDIFKSSGLTLANTSTPWEDRGQALLAIGAAIQSEDFKAIKADEHRYAFALELLKTVVFPRIASQLLDPRAQTCRDACRMVSEVVAVLKDDAQLLVENAVPALMKTLCSPKKVFVTFANNALLSVLADCQLVFLLDAVIQGTLDKNPVLRERCCHYLLIGLRKYKTEDLEQAEMKLEAILKSIKTCIADSKPEVRDMAFNCAQAIEGHWKDKYDTLVQSLDPTTAKQFAAMEAKKKSTPKPSTASHTSFARAAPFMRNKIASSAASSSSSTVPSASTTDAVSDAPAEPSTATSAPAIQSETPVVIAVAPIEPIETKIEVVETPVEAHFESATALPLIPIVAAAELSTKAPIESATIQPVAFSVISSSTENVENFLVTPLKPSTTSTESPLVSAAHVGKRIDWDNSLIMSSTPLVDKKQRVSVDSPLFAIPVSSAPALALETLEALVPIITSDISSENDASLLVEPVQIESATSAPAASCDLVLDENVLSEALEAISINNTEATVVEEPQIEEEIVFEPMVASTPAKPAATSTKSLIDCSLMEFDAETENTERTMTLRLATDGSSLLGDFDFSVTATPAKARKVPDLSNILVPELIVEAPEPSEEEEVCMKLESVVITAPIEPAVVVSKEEEHVEEIKEEIVEEATAELVQEKIQEEQVEIVEEPSVATELAEPSILEEPVENNMTGALRVVMQQQDGEELLEEEEISVTCRPRGFSLSTIDEMSEPYSPMASPRMSILSQLDMMPKETYTAEDWNTPSKTTSTPGRLSAMTPSMPSLAEESIGEFEEESVHEEDEQIAKELVLEYQALEVTQPQQETVAAPEQSEEKPIEHVEEPKAIETPVDNAECQENVLDVSDASEGVLAPISLHIDDESVEALLVEDVVSAVEKEEAEEDDANSLDFSSTIAAALESADMPEGVDFDDAIDNEFSSSMSHRASTSLGFDRAAAELLSSSPVTSSLEENIAHISSSPSTPLKSTPSEEVEALAKDLFDQLNVSASPVKQAPACVESIDAIVVVEEPLTIVETVEDNQTAQFEEEILEESPSEELVCIIVAPPPSPDDSIEQLETSIEIQEAEAVMELEVVEEKFEETVESVDVSEHVQIESAPVEEVTEVQEEESIAEMPEIKTIEDENVEIEVEDAVVESVYSEELSTELLQEEVSMSLMVEQNSQAPEAEEEIVELSIEEPITPTEETTVESVESMEEEFVEANEVVVADQSEIPLAEEVDDEEPAAAIEEEAEAMEVTEIVLEEAEIQAEEDLAVIEDAIEESVEAEEEEELALAMEVSLADHNEISEPASVPAEEPSQKMEESTVSSTEVEEEDITNTVAAEEEIAEIAEEIAEPAVETAEEEQEEQEEELKEIATETIEEEQEHEGTAAEIISEEANATVIEAAVESEASEINTPIAETQTEEEEEEEVVSKPVRGGRKAAKKSGRTTRGKKAAAAVVEEEKEDDEEETKEPAVVEEKEEEPEVAQEQEEQEEAEEIKPAKRAGRATRAAKVSAPKRATRGRGKASAAVPEEHEEEEKEEIPAPVVEEVVEEEPAVAVSRPKRGGRAKKAATPVVVEEEPTEEPEKEAEVEKVEEVEEEVSAPIVAKKTAKRAGRGKKAAAVEQKEEEQQVEEVEPEVVVEAEPEPAKPAKRAGRGKKVAVAPAPVEEEEEVAEPEVVVVEEAKPAKRAGRGKKVAAPVPEPEPVQEIAEVVEVEEVKPAKRAGRGKKVAAPAAPEPVEEEEEEVAEQSSEESAEEEEAPKPTTARGRAKSTRAKSSASAAKHEDESQKENGSSNVTVSSATSTVGKKVAKKAAPAKSTTATTTTTTAKKGLSVAEEPKPTTPIANRVRARSTRR